MEMQGVVMKISHGTVVFLCDDGKFRNLQNLSVQYALGQRIALPAAEEMPRQRSGRWAHRQRRIAAAAASLLMLFGLSVQLMRAPEAPEPVAMVAIDINPSIELMVDGDGNVDAVSLVNEDAQQLITEKELLDEPLYEAVEAIVSKAKEQGFLDINTEKKYVFMSVVDLGEHLFDVDLKKLSPILDECNFELYHTDQNTRRQAKEMGLTLNKFIVYEQAKQRGITLNTEELRTHSIALSLEDAGVNLGSFFGEQATAIQLGSEVQIPATGVTEQTDEALSSPAAVNLFSLQVQETPAVKDKPDPNPAEMDVKPQKHRETKQRAKKSGKSDGKREDNRSQDDSKDRDETKAQEDKSVEDHAGSQDGSERQDDDASGSEASLPDDPDDPDDPLDDNDADDPLDDGGTEEHHNPDSQEDHGIPGDVNSPVNPGSDTVDDSDDSIVTPGIPVNVDDKDSKEDKRKKTDQDDKHKDDNRAV